MTDNATSPRAHLLVALIGLLMSAMMPLSVRGQDTNGRIDALVEAVTAANPRTAVVLNTGDPVLMPWLSEAGAVLQMWYSGQEGASATAALLTGAANPSGKLPVTFPRRAEEVPTHPQERYPGVDGRATYSEGVFVGYRWYDDRDIDPLFPFGHGLSYTSFEYADLAVQPSGDGYDVRFRVRNTGSRPGATVPQVYLGASADPPVPMAPKQLAGFERIELAPGEGQQVTVHVPSRQLSYWSTAQHGWKVATGARTLSVGASYRDIRLRTEVTVAR